MMTDYFVKKLTALLKTDSMSDYEKEILEYGIWATFLNLPKTILVIYAAKKLKLLKPLMLIFLFYGMIRNYSRGIHAKTPWACFVAGTINYLGMAYLSTVLRVPQKVYHAIFAFCFVVYYRYAPSGTEVNTVYKDQIKPMKIRSLLTVLVYYFVGLKNGLIRNVVMLSLLSQSISILPMTYKIAKQRGGVIYEEDLDC